MKLKFIFALTLLCNVTVAIAADGTWWQNFVDGYYKFDRAIRRFLTTGTDSTYIRLPATSWEIPAVGKVYGYQTSISPENKPLNLSTAPVVELGGGIGYHGLDAVFTIAVKNAIDFNFEFDYYDNYWGIGINIGRETYGSELYGKQDDSGKEELASRAILLEGYYALFGKRFSYPAAVYGNYIQKKSAGSPLVTFWYEHRDYEARSEYTRKLFAGSARQVLDEGAILCGYGYNFSICSGRAVISLSASIGLPLPYLGIATNGRFAAMYWINDHFRINLNVVNFYQKSWSEKNMKMSDNTWRCAVGVAYCFGKLPD